MYLCGQRFRYYSPLKSQHQQTAVERPSANQQWVPWTCLKEERGVMGGVLPEGLVERGDRRQDIWCENNLEGGHPYSNLAGTKAELMWAEG